VAWSPDGVTLVTASRDNTVRLWSAETHEELLTIEYIAGTVLVRTSDGNFWIQKLGAVPAQLGIPVGDSRSVLYVPLAGLRNQQNPDAIAAFLRGEPPTTKPPLDPNLRWDGKVARISIQAAIGSTD
jgi:hypothetical protein